jgi:hypothetical protein
MLAGERDPATARRLLMSVVKMERAQSPSLLRDNTVSALGAALLRYTLPFVAVRGVC